MELDINYFNPAAMRPGAVVLVVGRRGSGKSTLAADIMSYQRDCKRGICVSGTEKRNPFWSQYIPQCFIRHGFRSEYTKEIFKMQAQCKKKKGIIEKAFIIYDDVMFDKDFMKCKLTREIFMNGRHSNIFTMVTAQWIMDVPPDLRANVDYVIVLRDNIKTNRERVYKYFAGMFDNFAVFDDVMKQCTSGRDAMVIDCNSSSYDVRESVYFYRATPELKYRLCDQVYWDYSARQAEGADEFDDNDEDAPRPDVRVKKRYPGGSRSKDSGLPSR